eukprot:CAMPEP_0170553464 /NCGR_PEP_ID=MMETSP0211-20121228/11292_1 /TAXON_ID=311385 /ORGANISM="Pseudokeronopsis sp., Strain OXSARD2" /LENGTH=44 /DNA_ID= /DNA_START= /DNA_END= /DNA_ORIENTATION=
MAAKQTDHNAFPAHNSGIQEERKEGSDNKKIIDFSESIAQKEEG